MKKCKSFLTLIIAVSVCVLLSACGQSADDPVVGDDWRVTGSVVGNGTITHDGESVDVLVTVSETSAAFYWDKPEQVLFDSVLFPITITDAQKSFSDITFNDIDGDGESDVLVRFVHENGDVTELVWIWDSVQRYVFSEDLSNVEIGNDNSSDSQSAYFDANGLQYNAEVDNGTYLLKNSICSYVNVGEGYNTGDSYWEVVKRGEQKHDGVREIEFDALCYVPYGSITEFDSQYITVTDSELYDYYTGKWFTASTAYNTTQRGDNHYIHTVEWNGNSYEIEFFYSTERQYNLSDWAMVFTKSYVVYFPEDYDGLVFAVETQADNYKDCAKRMQMDSISPEAQILDIDTLEPYSSLYFNICN